MALMTSNPVATMSRGDAQRTIHGYVLWELLGEGSYGKVYKAIAPGGRPAAVKIIQRNRRAAAELELDALEAIKHLDHPYLLKVFAAYLDPDEVVMVTELASGTLRDRLKVCRTPQPPSAFPVDELMHYMRQAAKALDYLHGEGKVHRDVKPDNFLLFNGKEPYIKLGDCGLVREYSEQNQEMTLQGTPAYIPPEVWGRRGGARSDQYSLAVTYAELRRGTRPFADSTPFGLMAAHQTLKPDLTGLRPAEQPIVARALAKDAMERFTSCLEFVEQLEAVFSIRPDSWRPGKPIELPQTKEHRESPPPSPVQELTSGIPSPPPVVPPQAPRRPAPPPPPTVQQRPPQMPATIVPQRPPTSPGMPPVSGVPSGLAGTLIPDTSGGPSRTINPTSDAGQSSSLMPGSDFVVDLDKHGEPTLDAPSTKPTEIQDRTRGETTGSFPLLKAVLALGVLLVVGFVGLIGYVVVVRGRTNGTITKNGDNKKPDEKTRDDKPPRPDDKSKPAGSVRIDLPAAPLWVAAGSVNDRAQWPATVKDAGPVTVAFAAAPQGLELTARADGGKVAVSVKAPKDVPPGVYRVGLTVKADGAKVVEVKWQERTVAQVDVHVFPAGFQPHPEAPYADGYYPKLVRDVGGPVVLCLLRPREGVGPFYLMQDKVTNGVFRQFAGSPLAKLDGSEWQKGGRKGNADANAPTDFPVLRVKWAEAKACASWLGGTLPTPQQYDRAAGDGTFRGTPAVNRRQEGPAPVSADADTAEGIRGLSGNGREWTTQERPPQQGKPLVVLRGRSYTTSGPLTAALIAQQRRPDLEPTQYADHASPYTGFRVAVTFPDHRP